MLKQPVLWIIVTDGGFVKIASDRGHWSKRKAVQCLMLELQVVGSHCLTSSLKLGSKFPTILTASKKISHATLTETSAKVVWILCERKGFVTKF